MAKGSVPAGPNFVHPEKPSAVGSRNSINRNNRDEYSESKLVIEEEVDKILNHISAKLPPEVLEKLHVGGGVKSLLHTYFNQSFQNMFNRYITTVEDEMGKKFRDLIDKDEFQNLNRYTPREISSLIDRIGGSDKFNTAEVEKSVVNIYGHLQGHVQRGVFDLEQVTNSILRQKIDVGSFVRGENTYAVVKCSFKDCEYKPEGVADIKLVINILEEELISPIYHYQVATDMIIKVMISDHISHLVNREVDKINDKLMNEGQTELSSNEQIFENFRGLEKHLDHGEVNDSSKQFSFVAYEVFEAIKGIHAEISQVEFDPLNFRENVKFVVDDSNLRNRGFNTAVNALTAILDTSRMGYQHIENFKNVRKLVIREYQDTNALALPDERYGIRLSYYDDLQLREMRTAHCQQLDELDSEIGKLWDVSMKLYNNMKKEKTEEDFDDISKRYLKSSNTLGKKFGYFEKNTDSILDEDEANEKLWDKITFVEPNKTKMEDLNATLNGKIQKLLKKLTIVKHRLIQIYQRNNPPARIIVEQRLNFLQKTFDTFRGGYNPFQVQPGLLVGIDISTVKRKRTTMTGMSNVLNEFLSGISKGFRDAAFAGYSRRRSTDQTANQDEFGSSEESKSDIAGVADL